MGAGTTVTIFGDTTGTLNSKAKSQTLIGVESVTNIIYGDAYLIEDSKGGNDFLTGGATALQNILHGDAFLIFGSRGGNDVLLGGANSLANFLYGDAHQMSYSIGGNDVITGGVSVLGNLLYGDSYEMSHSRGGNDVMAGGSNSLGNALYGDGYQMSHSRGGNDVLAGGANSLGNTLYGDAFKMSDSGGGDDILIASDKSVFGEFPTQNKLYGDAPYHLAGKAICGNDRLISGTGNDFMWGDIANSYNGTGYGDVDLSLVSTGQDVFVFSANNGTDTIHDFRQGEDKIELNSVGVTSFEALMAAAHLSQQDTNTVITFGSNTITVVGVTELTASDFIFT